MANTVGLRIAIEGEREFNSAVKEINAHMRTLASEMKLVESAFDKGDTSIEKMTEVNKVLAKQIDETKSRIVTITEALNNAADNFGENDSRTQKWRTELNKATADLNGLERELDGNKAAMSGFTLAVKESEKAVKEAENRDKAYAESVKDIEQNMRVLDSEMKLVESSFDKNASSVKKAAEVQKVLTKEVAEQKKHITELEAALKHSAAEFGENDKRTKEWQIQLNKAKTELNNMERELKEVSDTAKRPFPSSVRRSLKVRCITK